MLVKALAKALKTPSIRATMLRSGKLKMIHTLRFSAIFTLLAAALSSGTLSAGPQDIDPDVLSIAQGHNRFALSLYATVAAKTPDNIFLSPDSVHTALSMTSLGARGKTGHEMSTVLHHPFQGQILASTYRNFLQALQSPSQTHDKRPAYELTSSNALWPAMNYPILPAYIELVQSAFQAVCTPLDYQKDPELARKTINDKISLDTKDKIKQLIPQGMIDTQTRMVLTNAIYFRSSWDSPFSKEATREEDFHLNDGEKKTLHDDEKRDGLSVLRKSRTPDGRDPIPSV